jgi:hypothetical protein
MGEVRFRIVLQSVPRTRANAVRYELSRLFDIDEDIANDICGAAPIVILDSLRPSAAVSIKTSLASIAEKGAELHITDAPCNDIPKVNWPELPDLARDAMAEASAAATAVHASAPELLARFHCPRCREELSVVRSASLRPGAATPLASTIPAFVPVPAPETPAAPAPAPAEATGAPPAAALAGAPKQAPGPGATVTTRTIVSAPPSAPAAPTEPPEPLPVRHPDLEEGPLVRALQEKRQLRESQRLAAAEQPAPERTRPAPAADPRPEPPPVALAPEPAFAEPEAGPAPLSADHAPRAQGPAPVGALDIDEALRLLDNVIDEPAPMGVEAAPPPRSDLPELDDLLDGSDINDFADFEADLDDLSVAPEPAASAPSRPPAPPPLPTSSSAMLAPLDPEEALAILESARSPESGDEMIFERPAKGPVSDELEPLGPQQALALLAQTTAARKGRAPSRRERGAAPERKALSDSALDAIEVEPPPVSTKRSPSTRSRSSRSSARATSRATPQKGGAASSRRRRALEPGDADPVHGLVLSRITAEAKRQRAAEIIADLTGMPKTEARDLTKRAIIPVLKGVPRDTAEEALERFRSSKISGRVTTRRLG